MDKIFFIQLTSNIYKLTLLFPKKDPLRFKIRELATSILEDSVKLESSNPSTKIIPEILKNIKILDNFFDVAEGQNWVSPQEILKIKQEYSILKGELERMIEDKKFSTAVPEKDEKKDIEPLKGVENISSRQKKILAVLKQREKTQVRDIKEIFPEMSKRTLRRDFEKLLSQGFVERIGDKNDTFYQLR